MIISTQETAPGPEPVFINRLATCLRYPGAMTHLEFDATITLNDHHLEAAGLTGRHAKAVVAVRRAVEAMSGAGWIDVEAQTYPPDTPVWVVLYPRGPGSAPDTPEWRALRDQVEREARAALLIAGFRRVEGPKPSGALGYTRVRYFDAKGEEFIGPEALQPGYPSATPTYQEHRRTSSPLSDHEH